MAWLSQIAGALGATLRDVAPIMAILLGFQWLVLRERLPNARRILIGIAYAMAGLALFLIGLDQALFPLGRTMAAQLSAPEFIGGSGELAGSWRDYAWVYAFAAAIGFAATFAEPTLIAVALKAGEISGGALNPWGLRLAVALGVAVGVALGVYRIVAGTPLPYYIIAGYGVVIAQAAVAPRAIIPLAFDSGGVTTSSVTVPLIAALGLGLASTIPGRSPLIDGFGLIAFASLFPIITVMGYAQLSAWRARRPAGAPPKEG